MLLTSVNFLAVLAATVVNMLIGSLWYSPILLGTPWMKYAGFKKEDEEKMKKAAGPAMAGMLGVSLVMTYFLAVFLKTFGSITLVDGLLNSFWLWFGLIATTGFTGVLFEKRPLMLYLINTGYYLVSFLVMGTILTLWK